MLNISAKKAVYTVCPNFLHPFLNRVENSEIGYRLAKGTFWSLSGAVISKGLILVSSIIVARTLGKVGFGEFGIIYSTVAMFELFASFGLGVTATKYVAQYRQNDPLRAGRIISLAWIVTAITGALCAMVLAVFSPWIAVYVLAAPHLSGLLRITAISLFITALNASQNGAISGFEAFKTLAACNLIAGILNFPILVVGVLLAGLKGAVWANVVSCLFNWIISHLAVRREAHRFGIPLILTGCLQELPLLWKFSLPAVFAGMMVIPVNWICNAMLVNQPNGYAEMGVLNAANQWRNLVLFLPNILITPILSILSSNQCKTSDFKKTAGITQNFIVIITFPVCMLLMFSADWLMRLYWKTQGNESITIIGLMFATLIQGLGGTIGAAIAAKGRMWLGFVYNTGWALLYLSIVAYFVTWKGAAAVTFGQAIAYLFLTPWLFIKIKADLPDGMVKQFFLGLGLVCCSTMLCLIIPNTWRIWLAIPMAVGISIVTLKWLVRSEIHSSLKPEILNVHKNF